MALEDTLAKERIEYIAKQQALLETAVSDLQRTLFEAILIKLEAITKDPTVLDALFRTFTKDHHLKVINQFANDIVNVGKRNDAYFKSLLESDIPKNYTAIKKQADAYLLKRFGLTEKGAIVEEGFLDSFVKDPTIKRELKAYAYKATQSSGVGLDAFKKGFKDIIIGSPEANNGSLQLYYKQWGYDTYQQVDATIQKFYADKLALPAALYLGTKRDGSREFCLARKGKCFTIEEIKLFGTSKDKYGGYTNKSEGKFKGKPKTYNPFIDRGGPGCVDALNFVTAKMALRRRDDLELVDGKLQIKAT